MQKTQGLRRVPCVEGGRGQTQVISPRRQTNPKGKGKNQRTDMVKNSKAKTKLKIIKKGGTRIMTGSVE